MKKDQLWDDTSSMKKDWLYRGSYDEKNQGIAPMMMPNDDLDRVMMIQIQWWWSSSDDPDPVMISSDDPDPMMMPHDDPDQVMIQIQWWFAVMMI